MTVGQACNVEDPVLLPLVDPPLACSLGAQDLNARLEQWRAVLASVTAVAYEDETAVMLHLSAATSVADLAQLCADEVACCPFFTFSLDIRSGTTALRVSVPAGAAQLLGDLVRLLPADTPAGT